MEAEELAQTKVPGRSVHWLRTADPSPPRPARVVAPPVVTPAGEGPYRAYRPRPFTREERERVTLLFGGLHWRVERLLQGSLENLGYRARVLPTATRSDLLTGREVADIGQCCPKSFTTGNLANFCATRRARSAPTRSRAISST